MKKICDLEKELNTSSKKGLSSSEAKKRLALYGLNEFIDHKKVNWFLKFICQFKDPMILILIAADIISFVLLEYIDGFIILFVVLMNAIISFVQEKKAYNALESLKNLSSPHNTVIRDGKMMEVDAKEVVIGDLLYFEEGNIIPADCYIIALNGLKINESSLTGESFPVEKKLDCEEKDFHKLDELYASTEVLEGNAYALCYQTGKKTQIGKIASMTYVPSHKTPLEKKLAFLSKILGIITIVVCLAMFLVSVLRKENIFATLISSISLGVAAIPEGLPAVVTIVLSLGVQKMVKYKAIVSKLPCVETLGSVTVICSDKTGTLTENKMVVEKGYFSKECTTFIQFKNEISLFLLCSNATENKGDSLEQAIYALAVNLSINKEELFSKVKRIKEIPFSSEKKKMTTINEYNNVQFEITKGAPEVILKMCDYVSLNNPHLLGMKERKKIEKVIDDYSMQALRLIAVCLKYNHKTIFVGILGFKDPLRKEAKNCIKEMKEAYINVKMITGDHKNTAFAIAKEVGISSDIKEVMEGKEIDVLSEEEFLKKLPTITTFARVTPLHKMKIVKGYKKLNEVVAMTGDGVNDAPSLKEADVGIAMGKIGTDVAKDAADIILEDDRFQTIVYAIEEGRTIYSNIKKTVLFLLSSNIAEVLVMFFALVFKLPLPLLAIHILFVNLISDSLPALALGIDKKEDDVMKRKPRLRNDNMFSHGGIKILITYSIIIFILTAFSYFLIPFRELSNYNLNSFNDFKNDISDIFNNENVLYKARTYAFVTLSLSELFHMIGMSSPKHSLFYILKKKNYYLFYTFIAGLIIQILLCQVPFFNVIFKTASLNLSEWILLLLISSFPLLFHEIVKKDLN